MSQFSKKRKVPAPERIEVEGIIAMCRQCKDQTDKTTFLPEVSALTWKCDNCGHVNVLPDFNLPS